MLCSHQVIAQTIIFYNLANNKKCLVNFILSLNRCQNKCEMERRKLLCRGNCLPSKMRKPFLCVDIIKIF